MQLLILRELSVQPQSQVPPAKLLKTDPEKIVKVKFQRLDQKTQLCIPIMYLLLQEKNVLDPILLSLNSDYSKNDGKNTEKDNKFK